MGYVRLAGSFAGFVQYDGANLYEFACGRRILVVDLRDGKRREIDLLGSAHDGCQDATSFKLKANGSAAWITPAYRPDSSSGSAPHPPEVWAVDSRGRRLLDSGHISNRSLTLSGSTLTWRKDGVVRSATLY